ncbi:hypothetical protein AGOR_G00050150 [Albula goreensis]|uniref:Ubiquitin associated protein 1 n=1 Tax=Albula goreensis TaxID=1534307 RepID=A0A8T3DSQ5_9TELE|nr:hypothetical protein AGOR_G00050150 [Albula goreensis]
MAGRNSGSDFQNSGPCSYLDQVPFKIGDKFRSPAKVGLPVGFCLPDCTSVLGQFEYDFSLEHRVVRWGAELEAAKAAAQEKIQLEAEPQSKLRGGGGAPSQEKEVELGIRPQADSKALPLPPPMLNPLLVGLSHNAILTPLPAPSMGRPSPRPPPQQGLDLAEFEREEDPFDKLELKTIDDKEELRSILTLPPPQPPLNRGQQREPNGQVALPEPEEPRPCNIRSLTFPKLNDTAPGPTPKFNLTNGAPSFMRQVIPQRDVIVPAHQTMPRSDVITVMGPAVSQNDVIIPQTCDRILKQPPPRPLTGPTPQSPARSVVVPFGGGEGQRRALLSLTPAERQCVETIVAMGYPYEGVLRAMQKQGKNMEQVLDYLFVHGRLCERGFDASAVEECLEMYQCSEEKALEFLQLVSRFGEMGFEKDIIKEVLRVHNNDQDKALEDLMARAATS